MHLQIVRALVRSPPTECISLIADRTRENRKGALPAAGSEVDSSENMDVTTCFPYFTCSAEPIV